MRKRQAATAEGIAVETNRPARRWALLLLFGLFALVALWPAGANKAAAQPAATSAITIVARDLATNAVLPEFTFLVNVDNAHLGDDPDPLQRPGVAPTESNSPVVALGDQDSATVNLPDGRYLISIRSPDHKMWGQHITVAGADQTVDIALREGPFPLGKIRAFVFEDMSWANSAPDATESGLEGFHITIDEQTDQHVTVDYFNNPLCGGDCVTDADGFVQLDNLGPATYFVYATPPDTPCNDNPDSRWVQTSTFDGGFNVQAGVEEGSDGTGAPGEQLWEPPNVRTGYWFGFACFPTDFSDPGSGEIIGRALNWVGWPPFDNLLTDPNEPVQNPYIALSDSTTDVTVFVGQGDGDGNFDIQNVPDGTYNMAIWDEQLTYIIRFLTVTVSGETVELGDVGVSRWFGWLSGDVYLDENGNQVRDDGEPGIPNTDVDQRWRDGSIKEGTFTDLSGHYEYPTAEGGPLGKWIIGEQGFGRLGVTGASVHDELTGEATPVPTALGGALLTNQLLTEGHRSVVDWGKVTYDQDEPGQIVGITEWGTTRNEMDARMQATEDYEPAIPDVTVLLEGLGVDGEPNTADDPILNDYVTDHWAPASGCTFTDAFGTPLVDSTGTPLDPPVYPDLPGFPNPLIGQNCLEVPITGVQTKDGAFDGGYAFADMCPLTPEGASTWPCDDADKVPLVAGDYITHVVAPNDANGDPLYHIVREEDVNVDNGATFVPAIPPPPCVGDMHVIDQSTLVDRSPYYTGDQSTSPSRPLCDKKLVTLENTQNANADFFLMTNFPTGVDVQIPGRIIGLVSDDIYFDSNPSSPWFGEPRPVPNIPVGIRDYNYRLLTTVVTDENGSYEALLPSTETFNCPIPQGPCPGMYLVVVNDPGDQGSPNENYNPNYLTASLAWDVWPGLTTQLDTPLDPISGTGCDFSLGPGDIASTVPELLQVSRPYVLSTDSGTARRITIRGDFIGPAGPTGATGGRVTLTNQANGAVTTLTRANGGVVSWTPGSGATPDTIVIQVPAVSGGFPAGPRQLNIVGADSNGGNSSVNGITLHVLGSGYNPNLRLAPAPNSLPVGNPNRGHELQTFIDAAATTPGSLVVLRPGTYNENLVLWKRIILQGVGPGGIIGAHELQTRAPEDARFTVQGSVLDGRFFQDPAKQAAWDGVVSAHGPYAGVDGAHPVLSGANITVLAQSPTAYSNGLGAARVDGLGLQLGRGQGAGGIQLQAYANNLRITNNILESDGGLFAGAIGVGEPYHHVMEGSTDVGSHNFNVKILRNRILGSGGLSRAGGVGIFNGANNYEIANSIFCANYGVLEYGGGISHWGLSPNGSIHDNQIYYNTSFDSGGGVVISHEVPVGDPLALGQSSGAVNIDANLIQSNASGDDGGGIFVQNAHTDAINIRNNMIVNNLAADLGGAITLDDSSNVRLVNNTIANNASTGSAEDSDGNPHSAGLASEANSPNFSATLPASSPSKFFSNPVQFNNIFWNNDAFTLSQAGPGATLVDNGFLDFEVNGTCAADVNPTGCTTDTYSPRYTLMTNGNVLGPDNVVRTIPANPTPPIAGFPTNPTQNGNIVGVDPLFITPFVDELTVAGSALDPQTANVTITGQDPPVGLTGNYHLQTALLANQLSGAVDRGIRCSNTPVPPPLIQLICTGTGTISAPTVDIDGQARPQLRTLRLRTPFDLGADEVPTSAALAFNTAVAAQGGRLSNQQQVRIAHFVRGGGR
jgi:hypothetical protein